MPFRQVRRSSWASKDYSAGIGRRLYAIQLNGDVVIRRAQTFLSVVESLLLILQTQPEFRVGDALDDFVVEQVL